MEDLTRLELLLPIDLSTPLACAVISCLYIYFFIFCILRSFYKTSKLQASSRTMSNGKGEGGNGTTSHRGILAIQMPWLHLEDLKMYS